MAGPAPVHAQTDDEERDPTPEVLPQQLSEDERMRVWDDPRSPYAPGDQVVALTFDDGPHPTHTPDILDVLDAYDAPGTFFMNGIHMEDHPGIVADAHERGHGVANHTHTHPDLTDLSDPEIRQEAQQTHDLIARHTGRHADCLRPPFGSRDQRVLDVLAGEGYASAMWSVDPRDWEQPASDVIVQRVMDGLSPGAVIILHDGPPDGNRQQTVAALPDIIEQVRGAGYEIVPFCHPPLATDRIGGDDRAETAALISQRTYPDGADTALVAVASDFPDALAAGPAAANAGQPILLVRPDGVPQATAAELERLECPT